MFSSLRSRTGAAAVSVAGAALALVATATPASAGTNGQQIEFFDRQSSVYSIWINGFNQYGQQVTHCVNTPGETTWVSGWWWKGQNSVVGFNRSDCNGDAIWSTRNDIPVSQPSDWYLVSD
ncbi:hypothetical protein [Streptomyces sp. NPDC048623]|uniref:hypothetical protein n=1 Tax=Streptomyces sp. NPDC048623 TaxID=3155761 RepID=UPI003431E751